MKPYFVMNMAEDNVNKMMNIAERINAEISFRPSFVVGNNRYVQCECTNQEKAGRLRSIYNEEVRKLKC